MKASPIAPAASAFNLSRWDSSLTCVRVSEMRELEGCCPSLAVRRPVTGPILNSQPNRNVATRRDGGGRVS